MAGLFTTDFFLSKKLYDKSAVSKSFHRVIFGDIHKVRSDFIILDPLPLVRYICFLPRSPSPASMSVRILFFKEDLAQKHFVN